MKDKLSRRRFIGLGATLGAAAALAACGANTAKSGSSNSGGSSSGASGGSSSGGSSSGGSGQAIASESQVPAGSAATFKSGGMPAVLVHLKSGKFVAYSAVCTHQGCTVAYKNGELACPCHGSVFNPANGGAVVNGPATQPLPKIPVQTKGGKVYQA